MNRDAHDRAALLLALGQAGIELAVHPSDPDRLRYRPATLPPELAARLRLHKAGLVALFRAESLPMAGSPDGEYVMHERLGIADELEMPTHRGSPAWMIAVGEGAAAQGGHEE